MTGCLIGDDGVQTVYPAILLMRVATSPRRSNYVDQTKFRTSSLIPYITVIEIAK
jgi:hypothetical protein